MDIQDSSTKSTGSSSKILVPDPPIFQVLFGNVNLAWLWLIIRLYVGWKWLNAGWDKVTNSAWVGAKSGTAMTGFVNGALSKTTGEHPDVQGWYATFLRNVVLPQAGFWGYIVSFGELFVGIGLILGALTGIAAFFGFFMNLNYLLAGSVSTNPILLVLGLLLILAWKTAGWWGLDKMDFTPAVEIKDTVTTSLSSLDAARLVETAEAEAYVDLFRAAPAYMGFQVFSVQAATMLLSSDMDIPLFNRVLGLGLQEPATMQSIDWIIDQFWERHVHNFAIQICPAAQPQALAGWLEARQLQPRDNWAKVYRPTHPPITIKTDLRIERIGVKYAEYFARVASTAFEMPERVIPWLEATIGRPGWHHFLAWDDSQPVACAALYITSARVGWLGIAGTLPSHRRRGAQGALMAHRIRLGAALGCDWLVTETGEDISDRPNPSYHNMLRTGFRLAYQRPNYFLQPVSLNSGA